MILKGKNGYNISYEENIPENCNAIVVAMHGFAGDKESTCIKMLENKLKAINVGLIRFDWPAHGSSETTGDNLNINNCLSDLDSIIEYLNNKTNNRILIAFSTSFGGYLTLLYHNYNRNVFKHIILRSPAIKMYNVVLNNLLTDEMKEDLRQNSYFNYGFERNIKVTLSFIEELRKNDAFNLFDNCILDNITIIHGTDDDVVPINDSIEFANLHKCKIYPIDGADHRYKKDGELDKVIKVALDTISNVLKKI